MSYSPNFRTEVDFKDSSKYLNHSDSFILIGSCFSLEMSKLLKQNCFNVLNPYGTIYNPISIASNIKKLLNNQPFTQKDIIKNDDVFLSWNHSGKYYNKDSQLLLKKINKEQNDIFNLIQKKATLIITFGTSYLYELEESNKVVANCHKQSKELFLKRRCSIIEIVNDWREVLKNTKNKFILTVSPVRHLKEGLVENNLSKSVLLLAIDELCKEFSDRVSYFPSYELLIDELRDYRFYGKDWIHPSAEAVDFIWKKFTKQHLNKNALDLLVDISKIRTALAHRPKFGINKEYLIFLEKTLYKINKLKPLTPKYDWKEEILEINFLINKKTKL